jgi:hypothetical protein
MAGLHEGMICDQQEGSNDPDDHRFFERSPDRGQELARDMRVRWVLEEVGDIDISNTSLSPRRGWSVWLNNKQI